MIVIGKLVFSFLRTAGNLAIVLIVLPVFLSCHYDNGLSVTISPDGRSGLSRLAVLPFREIAPENAALKTVSCPLCAAVFHAEKFPLTSLTAVENVFL